MSSIIVCGDIHGKVSIVESVLSDPKQTTIFIGDYLDAYDATAADQIKCIELIMDAVENRDNVVALMGNHELSYLYPDYRCSGWNAHTQDYVDNNRLRMEGTLQLFAVAEGFLITHAGVSDNFLPVDLDRDLASVMGYLDTMPIKRIHEVSRIRSGPDPVGGPFWCDWDEFVPIQGIKQIVGHTRYRTFPDIGIVSKGDNFNIDCLDSIKEVLEISKTGVMYKQL
jgi:hypothetical protein